MFLIHTILSLRNTVLFPECVHIYRRPRSVSYKEPIDDKIGGHCP
jgi:hypothetical protein